MSAKLKTENPLKMWFSFKMRLSCSVFNIMGLWGCGGTFTSQGVWVQIGNCYCKLIKQAFQCKVGEYRIGLKHSWNDCAGLFHVNC